MMKTTAAILASVLFATKGDGSVDNYDNDGNGKPCHPGAVDMYFGDLKDIPYGFQLCDGTNDTPDLRDRFLVGAGKQFQFGARGGDSKIYLTADQLPSHRHEINKNKVEVVAGGEHTHVAEGTITKAWHHTHDAGSLNTDNAGSHTHTFAATASGGGHGHQFKLETERAGDHSHEIATTTDEAGDHIHGNDFAVGKDGSDHGHDIEIKISPVDDHIHGLLVNDFDIKIDDHVHGVGHLMIEDHYFSHFHELVDAYADTAGDHDHAVQGETSPSGAHSHGFDLNTDAQGRHEHNAGTLAAKPGGEHLHDVDAQETKKSGDHDHTFDAYLESTYDTQKENEVFDVALDRVDLTQGYKIGVGKEEAHDHIVAASATDTNGAHTHGVIGTCAKGGEHCHDVLGEIFSAGEHIHQIDTSTIKNGDHAHTVTGVTDKNEMTLTHTLTGESGPAAGFSSGVEDLYGKTDLNGAHTHVGTAATTSIGEHTHKLTGSVFVNGKHSHIATGEADNAGNHNHVVYGKIGNRDDGKHKHSVTGETEAKGEHSHEVKGKTSTNGKHDHEIDVYLQEDGKHTHSVGGQTEYVGDGKPIQITPPFFSIYVICCPAGPVDGGNDGNDGNDGGKDDGDKDSGKKEN